MLSIVVVGRNDAHGYNLSQRVATSLNSIASNLSFPDDEIIFVDWNTPISLPPMPLSIRHLLTDECKMKLKLVRVPPKVHNHVKGQSNKPLLEPIARNTGIRRANPKNKWLLSTNTDMIFVGENPLAEHVDVLEDKLWTSYRYEIPEFLWEQFNSLKPGEIHHQIKEFSKIFDLKRRISIDSFEDGKQVTVDAVGDFQLATLDNWMRITGFPEDMLLGWHVDSRATISFMNHLGKPSGILEDYVLETYHQNHLRTLTNYHSGSGNAPEIIYKPYLNSDTWGLSNFDLPVMEFKEFLIESKYIDSVVKVPRDANIEIEYEIKQIKDSIKYELAHVALYLSDIIFCLPPKQKILLLTLNSELINFIKNSNFMNHTIYDTSANYSKFDENNFDLVILDFGIDSSFTQSNSNYFSNFISVLYDKHFAANAEFIFIRVQNWGIRTIVRHFFNVPLFNNYTQLLNGCRKKKINFSFNANILLSAALSGVKTDYEKYSNFKIANSEKIHYKFFELTIKIFKSLPTPLKQRLKSIFKI